MTNWPAYLRAPASRSRHWTHRRMREGLPHLAPHAADGAGRSEYLIDPAARRNSCRPRQSTACTTSSERQTRLRRSFDSTEGNADVLHHQGILNHKLPWGLVLLGVMIALTLEMSASFAAVSPRRLPPALVVESEFFIAA